MSTRRGIVFSSWLLFAVGCGPEASRPAVSTASRASSPSQPQPRLAVSPLRTPADVRTPVAPEPAPRGNPDAIVDLKSDDGAALVSAAWRYSDVRLVDAASRGPGADLKPTGHPVRTYDYEPKASPALFDDSKWETLKPSA